MEIIEKESHPAFGTPMGKPSPPEIKHERIWDMMQAAERYGFDAFWNADPDWQAMMVAHMILDNAETALRTYDMDPVNH